MGGKKTPLKALLSKLWLQHPLQISMFVPRISGFLFVFYSPHILCKSSISLFLKS